MIASENDYTAVICFKITQRGPLSRGHISYPKCRNAVHYVVLIVHDNCSTRIYPSPQSFPTRVPRPRNLAPFLDEVGILFVEGRLRQSTRSYEQRHPILLLKAQQYFDHIPITILHPGLHITQSTLWQCSQPDRSHYSIYARFTPSPPSNICGADYCGPS